MKLASISPLKWWQFALSLVALILTWPALYNGGPIYFPDTGAYVRGADALSERLTGHRTVWTRADDVAALSMPSANSANTSPALAQDRKPVLAGRSVYYGVMLYLAAFAGGFGLIVIAQALLTGAVIVGLTRHFVDPRHSRAFAVTVAGTTAALCLTPLPFFVSFLMPDLFTGLGLIGVAAVLAGWSRESKAGRIGWLLLILAAMLFHASNIAIFAVLLICAVLIWIVFRCRAIQGRAAVALAMTVIGALAGEVAFSRAVVYATGAPPVRPPFLTARLIADGPGTEYLRAECPSSGFLLCRYRARLPQHSDSFLWSTSPAVGVFSVIPYRERYLLAAEERAFVIAVIAHDPLAVVLSSARSIGEQFATVGLSEFNYPKDQRDFFVAKLPVPVVRDLRQTLAWREAMPIDYFAKLIWPTVLIGLAISIGFLANPAMRRFGPYFVILMGGWLINIAVCGAVSTPHDRYNARALWAVQLATALVIAAKLGSNYRLPTGAGDVASRRRIVHNEPGDRPV